MHLAVADTILGFTVSVGFPNSNYKTRSIHQFKSVKAGGLLSPQCEKFFFMNSIKEIVGNLLRGRLYSHCIELRVR